MYSSSSLDYILLSVLFSLLWVIIPIAVIVFITVVIIRRRRQYKTYDPRSNRQWYLNPFLNSTDTRSQALILVSYLFLPALLNVINRSLPTQVEWQILLMIWAILGIVYAAVLKNVYIHMIAPGAFSTALTAQLIIWSKDMNYSAQWAFPYSLWWGVILYSLSALAIQKKPWQRFYVVHQFFSILGFTFTMFLFSTRIGLEMLSTIQRSTLPISRSLPIILTMIILAGIAIGTTMVATVQKTLHQYEAFALAIFICMGIGLLMSSDNKLTYESSSYYYYSSTPRLTMTGYIWSISFNVIAFILPVAVMFSGVYRQERWRINIGILSLLLMVFIKYFDWFFTFLDKSVFFIFAGVLLLGLGYFLERLRRYMVRTAVEKKV